MRPQSLLLRGQHKVGRRNSQGCLASVEFLHRVVRGRENWGPRLSESLSEARRLRLIQSGGKGYDDRRALGCRGLECNVAAVILNNFLNHRKPPPGSIFLPLTLERLDKSAAEFLRETRAHFGG